MGSLLLRRDLIRVPPIALPAAAFFLWTLLSAAFSDAPAAGLPQIKKFYVWLILIAVYSLVRRASQVKALLLTITAAASASAAWSLVQFVIKYQRAATAGVPFYQSYEASRITGFMSHWMTFGGHMLLAGLLVAAYLFLGRDRDRNRWVAAGVLLSLGLMLGLTRSVWAGAAVGLVYLVWYWKRWALVALPVVAGVAVVAAPEPMATRLRTVWQPGKQDMAHHRDALRRTGWRMVQAHPVFGVGPEQVARHFLEYLPEDVPQPVPKHWWYDHLHNIYAHFAAERGIPALLALLWMLGRALWDFHRGAAAMAGPWQWVLRGGAACIVGILVEGWGEVNLGDSEVLATLLSILACGYSILVEQPILRED
ncbi:MAG: O-antigen ligase family protein [Bryobacteraceae bacterium]